MLIVDLSYPSWVFLVSSFAMGVVVALSLVSFLGFRPAKRLPRFFSFSGLVSDVAAGVSSLTGAGVVSSTAGSVVGAGSVVFAALGSGEGSLGAALLLPKMLPKPDRDLRLSFFDGSV